MTVSFILGSYLCDQNDQVDTRLSSSATLAASMTSAADANAAQETPPASPPQKPQWYWVGSNDQHATDYKWRLQYYANNHMDSTTKHIVSDLNDMRIGVSTYGDYGGHIADATAPLDFANGEATRMKLDTLLQLMRQKCTWTYDDSLQAAIKLIRDHPDLGETDKPQNKSQKKKKKWKK